MSDIGSINIELDSIESSPLLARVSDSLIKCLIHSHGLSKVVHSKRVLCIVYGIHFLYMWYVSYVEVKVPLQECQMDINVYIDESHIGNFVNFNFHLI